MGSWGKKVPISQRNEFQDVTPAKIDDGEYPLVQIQTDEVFNDVHSYFHAIKDELSERVLKLTEEVIDCNAADYTVWWYRRQCLLNLEKSLEDELEGFTSDWMRKTTKNYQVWFHRKWLIEKLDDPKDELQWCADLLLEENDHKIYNVWSHRLFVLRKFHWTDIQRLKIEMGYSEYMLKRDVLNNSAWNHRHTILMRILAMVYSGDIHDLTKHHILKNELGWVDYRVREEPCNESAWNYCSALLELLFPQDEEKDDAEMYKCHEYIESVFLPHVCERAEKEKEEAHANGTGASSSTSASGEGKTSTDSPMAGRSGALPDESEPCPWERFLLSFEAQYYVAKSRFNGGGDQKELEIARRNFENLAKQDAIRVWYWQWRIENIRKEFPQLAQ